MSGIHIEGDGSLVWVHVRPCEACSVIQAVINSPILDQTYVSVIFLAVVCENV